MPPKKAARTESSKTAAEAKRQELQAWLRDHDKLLGADSTAITIRELFLNVVSKKTFTRNGSEHSFDWSVFRSALEARHASSPRWFVQLREEDLLLEPDGLEGAAVECFVVAEASEPTLAPAQYVVKQHWPNSDLEDNAPERVMSIADEGMFWRPVVKDDGSATNTFVLSNRDKAPTAAAPISFGFGVPTPAQPAVAPLATSAPAAGTATFGFGFGSTAAAAPAPPPSFSFGTSAPLAALPSAASFSTALPVAPTMNFGFGATPAPSGGAPTAATTAAATPPHTPLRPSEVFFVLWSKRRVKAMLKELASGSRIVHDGVKIGTDGKTIKLVMQNDLKDDVDATVHDLLLNKVFAKSNGDVKKVDKWLDDCPVYDEHLAPHLQKFRAKFLRDKSKESQEFDRIMAEYSPALTALLRGFVSVRKGLVEKESKIVSEIAELLEDGKIADKSTFTIRKYYAENSVLPFRPFGKVSGISESGEHVDSCYPPMYVFKNKLLKE